MTLADKARLKRRIALGLLRSNRARNAATPAAVFRSSRPEVAMLSTARATLNRLAA